MIDVDNKVPLAMQNHGVPLVQAGAESRDITNYNNKHSHSHPCTIQSNANTNNID